MKRIRGAIGLGITWGAAWSGAGLLLVLAVLLATGERPDIPVPIVFGAFGFLGGVVFSGMLTFAAERRSLERMSLGRFAASGAAAGMLLAAAFVLVVAMNGNPSFLWNLVAIGPIFGVAGASSAAGSLALARRTDGASS